MEFFCKCIEKADSEKESAFLLPLVRIGRRLLLDVQHDNRLGWHLDGNNVLLQFGILISLGCHDVGMLEIVEVGYVLRSQNLAANGLGLIACQLEVSGQGR